MRVVAGTLKGRRLVAPPAGDLSVRPTADRAREALFSILQRWGQGPFLDLCAGTGAVGLEAHSRGFGPVVCVESGEPGWTCLRRNLADVPVQALRADVNRLKAATFRDQAVIFLDPPYEQAAVLWSRLSGPLRSWIASDGVLVFETDRKTTLELQPGWNLAETREYGAARFHFWIPA
ncbi:MAG: RsmD family RNA methyltransferase [Geothrix sp.]|uniref:RsmD family RNA methyltransferase n=1 Tax=Geothrix sp. TaxID=1962974 RepID=UPI0017DCD0CB|nr:RsmD family RNA methyltransferase [Geothrix sp.]NWJ39626.1 RsmD family RNA methyltransferase [Geothrix sp.]WIL22352.1 MAG: RsmD family RNA methyltransferase [Geothrix sp.]